MNKTEAVLRKLFAALPAAGYDLGILSDAGMYRLEAVPSSRVLRMIPREKRSSQAWGRTRKMLAAVFALQPVNVRAL